MNNYCVIHNLHRWSRISYKQLFIFAWCAGLLSGTYVVSRIPLHTFTLMRSSFSGERFSIVGFLLILSLPLLLSVISVASDKPLLVLPVLFIKAFLFSVCWFSLYKAFGSAGWLISFLALLPEIFVLFLTILYLFRNIEQRNVSFVTDYLVSQIIVIMIGFADFTVISPIWVDIISI